jgi:hypothetical protein
MQNKRQPQLVIQPFHHPKNPSQPRLFTKIIVAKSNNQSQEKSGSLLKTALLMCLVNLPPSGYNQLQ